MTAVEPDTRRGAITIDALAAELRMPLGRVAALLDELVADGAVEWVDGTNWVRMKRRVRGAARAEPPEPGAAYVSGRLLTTREVAERLGMSTETVLRRWRAGEIPGYRLASNVLRFSEADLDEWLEGQRSAPCVRLEAVQ